MWAAGWKTGRRESGRRERFGQSDGAILHLMRVPLLINVSAGLCAAFSLLGLIYVAMLGVAAPGYIGTLTGGPKALLILLTAISAYGLLTAVGVLRRYQWARSAILLLACLWIAAGVVSMWALAIGNAPATQFITPMCQLLIGGSWLLLFNAQRTKACFSRRPNALDS